MPETSELATKLRQIIFADYWGFEDAVERYEHGSEPEDIFDGDSLALYLWREAGDAAGTDTIEEAIVSLIEFLAVADHDILDAINSLEKYHAQHD